MPKILSQILGQFTSIGQIVTLNIPDGAEVAALRLYQADQTICIFTISDPAQLATHARLFQMISGPTLPENFIKYIGSFVFGSVTVHVIEVSS